MKQLNREDWIEVLKKVKKYFVSIPVYQQISEIKDFIKSGILPEELRKIPELEWISNNINGDSLCEDWKNSPLKVALQMFYSSLHPSFQGNELDLSFLNNDISSYNIINEVFRQWFTKIWINDNILKDTDFFNNLLKLSREDNWMKILELIKNNDSLDYILEDYNYNNLLKLSKKDNWMKKIKLLWSRDDFFMILEENKVDVVYKEILEKQKAAEGWENDIDF